MTALGHPGAVLRFRRGIGAALVFVSALYGRGVEAAAGVDRAGTISVEGRVRRYLLHVPPRSREAAAAPLVIVLHGDAGSAREAQRITGMDAVADRHGFFVAYPEGSGWADLPPRSWNAGTCCGYARNARVDDVQYLRALIAHLLKTQPIDPQRVYATGISNGGMMAHRLGCELSDRIAAIAPVAAALAVPSCAPQRPVPILMFHGTADRAVPYDGGRGSAEPDGRMDPAAAAVASFWAAHNRCASTP